MHLEHWGREWLVRVWGSALPWSGERIKKMEKCQNPGVNRVIIDISQTDWPFFIIYKHKVRSGKHETKRLRYQSRDGRRVALPLLSASALKQVKWESERSKQTFKIRKIDLILVKWKGLFQKGSRGSISWVTISWAVTFKIMQSWACEFLLNLLQKAKLWALGLVMCSWDCAHYCSFICNITCSQRQSFCTLVI